MSANDSSAAGDMRAAAERLLEWYRGARRDLPWRKNPSPYTTWISEIFLQQTRVEAVKEKYEEFLCAFPDVFTLAQAPLSRVLKLWEGMGYYSRARNLHKAAQIIASERRGVFPAEAGDWEKLPGIGAYTAGAIASIACGKRAAAIDGNVIRIFSRLLALDTPCSTPSARQTISHAVMDMLPEERCGDFNQALMDLGALVCMPRRTLCEACPLSYLCQGMLEEPLRYPVKAPKPGKALEARNVVIAIRNGKTLVRQREDKGLLAGLWEFPAVKDWPELKQIGEAWQYRHVFTHRIWDITVRAMEGDPGTAGVWADAEALRALPFPSAMEPCRAEAIRLLEDEAL